jgi:hypothetical protein
MPAANHCSMAIGAYHGPTDPRAKMLRAAILAFSTKAGPDAR